jgi:hypothetical protein
VNLKDQKLQPYDTDGKRSTKCYTKLFNRLLNISIHNAFVLYRYSQNVKKLDPLTFRFQVITELFDAHRKEVELPCPDIPLKTLQPGRLTNCKTFCRKDSPIRKRRKAHA